MVARKRLETICSRRLYMTDGLYCLRFYTVISGNYQHRYIRYVRAPRSHRRKSFVSRRIQEDYLLSVYLNFRRAYVLCNAAGLSGSNVCVSNCIKKRRFSMIYMAQCLS